MEGCGGGSFRGPPPYVAIPIGARYSEVTDTSSSLNHGNV